MPDTGRPALTAGSFPPVERLLDHRGSMLLLDAVTAYEGETLEAHYRVRAGAWYAGADGAMPGWMGVEIMAQSIAAHSALSALEAGRAPRSGALLGTRQYVCRQPGFAADAELCARARRTYHDVDGLAAYECALSLDGAEVASAVLTVIEPENFDAFLTRGATP